MGVFPNLEITLRVDRRLDYTCESKNKSKCFVFPVYLVFHPIYLKGKWWEGRKGKKCSPCFGTLTSPYTTSKITWQLKPYHHPCFPRSGHCVVQILCYAVSGMVFAGNVEFWRNYNIPPLRGGAAWFPIMTLCSFPSPGCWSKLGPQSGMHNMLFHQPPRNFLPFKAGYCPTSHRACLTSPCHSNFSFLGTQSLYVLPKAFPWYIVTHSPCDISGTVESPCNISCVSAVGCKLFENIC